MKEKLIMCVLLTLFVIPAANAQDKKPKAGNGAKTLSGMSIVGNDEAPKALYLVPWKSSEIGREVTLDMPGSKAHDPVNREEFRRKIDYYYIGTTGNTGR